MSVSRPTDASATPRSADAPLAAALAAVVAQAAESPARLLAVAYSGGRDSTALLHATARAASLAGLQVLALHVHHGLQPQADDWVRHGQATCDRWAASGLPVRFAWERLTGSPGGGQSVEDWARRGRYGALRRMALRDGACHVLLAHHRQDQAETFLLQALRGAGAAGLASMPRVTHRDDMAWHRPWLDQSPTTIADYVATHRLPYVDDPSNADPGLARNRLRLQVWPALIDAFPDAMGNLALAARWAHEASRGAQDMASLDLARVVADTHDATEPGRADHEIEGRPLDLTAWHELPPERGSQALRRWLLDAGAPVRAGSVQALVSDLQQHVRSAWALAPCLRLRRYRGRLWIERPSHGGAGRPPPASDPQAATPLDWPVPVHRTRHALGEGAFELAPVATGGFPVARVPGLAWRHRRGGDRFSLGPGRPPRALKLQFQAVGCPAWRRDGPILVERDDATGAERIVFVPGLGLDARACGRPGELQVAIRWLAKGEGERIANGPGREPRAG